jgi:hypothetical protein
MPVPLALLFLASAQAATLPPPASPQLSLPGCSGTQGQSDVTVCGHRDESSGYRLPQPEYFDPAGSVDSVSRERHRMLDVGASGTHSCSPVGPGGWTGCMLTTWQNADEQYAGTQHRPHEGTFQLGPIGIVHPE